MKPNAAQRARSLFVQESVSGGMGLYPFSNVIPSGDLRAQDFDYHLPARYRWHNAEVIEHFKNRPDDLLVMRTPRGQISAVSRKPGSERRLPEKIRN